jgi:small subunit ribosomal protein S19e
MSQSRAITVKDVSAQDFIAAYAKFLKKSGKIEVPKWVDIVKTGHFKELPPSNPDWYYIRIASMARKIYIRGGVGVGSFRKIYGGSKRNGTKPCHFALGSGAIARHALKQLEKLQVIEKDPKGGRKITVTGQRDLDRIAGQIVNKTTNTKKITKK